MLIEQQPEGSYLDPIGNVDGIYHHYLTGWFCKNHKSLDGTLTLVVNGATKISCTANLRRADVAEKLGYGGNSGYSFDLSGIEISGVAKLSVVHLDSRFDFHGVELLYCRGVSERYQQLKELFFAEYYRCKYGLEALSGDAAFQHFIEIGIYRDFNPNPWFSNAYYRKNSANSLISGEPPLICYLKSENEKPERVSELFDPEFYKTANPDLHSMHKLLNHFVNYGRAEGRRGFDISLPEHILLEFEAMSDIEPALTKASGNLNKIVRYPYITKATYIPRLLKNRFSNQIKAVVCVPFISRGGADLISTYLFRAYQDAYGKKHVLLIITDSKTLEVPEWIEDGSQVVCLDDECEFVDMEERITTLHSVLGMLSPEKIININSNATWKLFEKYGMQLSSVADLHAYLFCFDFNEKGHRVGYISEYFPSVLKYLKSVFCDNNQIILDMQKLYGYSEREMATFNTVYVPAGKLTLREEYKKDSRRNSILWIGRLAKQKRPDTLIKIANSMPGQKFVVYGPAGNSPVSDDIINGKYNNIEYRGVYNTLDEIDYSEFILYLNTSEWDGLPTIIIQMMSIGLPIVTSTVGGIMELVSNETGWLVNKFDDANEYAREMRKVMINHGSTTNKIQQSFTSVDKSHTWNTFYNRLESIGAFIEHSSIQRKNIIHMDRRQANQ